MTYQSLDTQKTTDIQAEECSMTTPVPSPTPGQARLARVVRRCAGWSPALLSGLSSLDDATARALAAMLEQLQAQSSRSTRGAWVRGFTAGQQS
jgi:hypothetical protein